MFEEYCPYHSWYLTLNAECAIAKELNCSVMELDEVDDYLVSRVRAKLLAEQLAPTYHRIQGDDKVH